VAGRIKTLSSLRSRFSHLGKGALFRGYAHIPLLERWQEFSGKTLVQLEKDALKHAGEDQKVKATIRKFFKEFAPNLKTDFVDFGLALRKPAGKPAVLIAGVKIQNAGKLER